MKPIWFLAAAMLLLLALGSCTKGGKPKVSNHPTKATAADAEARAEMTGDLVNVDNELLNSTILKRAQHFGFVFNVPNNSLVGPGTPPSGVQMAICMAKARDELKLLKGMTVDDYDKAVDNMYLNLLPVDQRGAILKEKGDTAQAPSEQPAPESPKLAPAPEIVGQWRSIQEERDRLAVKHDDQYYETLTILSTGNLTYNMYRKGQLFVTTEYTYKYSPGSGQLALYGKGNAKAGTYKASYDRNKPDLLYLYEDSSGVTKIFMNTGRADAPYKQGELPAGGLSPTPPKQKTK